MIPAMLVILAHQFIGETVAAVTRIPVPGNVIGMVLLFISLRTGVVRLETVKAASDVLLKNMAFLFVPPGAGLVLYLDLIGREFLAISVTLLVTTLLTIAVIGWVVEGIEKKTGGAS